MLRCAPKQHIPKVWDSERGARGVHAPMHPQNPAFQGPPYCTPQKPHARSETRHAKGGGDRKYARSSLDKKLRCDFDFLGTGPAAASLQGRQ
jgi:hypothetical protein